MYIGLNTRLNISNAILKNDYDTILLEMANSSGLFSLDQEWFSRNIDILKEKAKLRDDYLNIKENYNL